MGCFCENKNEIKIDSFPFEKAKEYNLLKPELNQIILDPSNINRKNENKLLELLNKTSNIMSEFERVVNDYKSNNENFNYDMLNGLKNDIKDLREYKYILNTMIEECKENNNNYNSNTILNTNQYNNNNYNSNTNLNTTGYNNIIKNKKKGISNYKNITTNYSFYSLDFGDPKDDISCENYSFKEKLNSFGDKIIEREPDDMTKYCLLFYRILNNCYIQNYEWELIPNEIASNQLEQSKEIGNCYMVSALESISHIPYLLTYIFGNEFSAKQQKFKVTFKQSNGKSEIYFVLNNFPVDKKKN